MNDPYVPSGNVADGGMAGDAGLRRGGGMPDDGDMAGDRGLRDNEPGGGSDVAVVGLAGRFPGAGSVDELWRLLRAGRRGIRPLSSAELRAAGVDEVTLRDPTYVKVGAPLDGVELFDAGFFGFSPRDAAIMDPQHRAFLEAAWEALEAAGHTPERFAGSIGVFAGCGMQAYFIHNLLTNPDLVRSVGMFLLRHTGNDKDFLTTRASYLLDLTGPSVSVQTACSTSLVAIHLASQSLLSGECDLALAGGVTIEVPHGQGYHYREGEILAPDGHCRAFDARAAGTVFGSGVGVVALRRLADALADGDTIHAVIKGSAVNNDGALKAGYLAPSVEGQARAVAEALAVAGVAPETLGYVEAHGTGTPVGDPIEVAALTQALGTDTAATGSCRIGSIKPSIGHLDTAAGVASFIKATLALKHGEIPASLDFEAPNPAIDFAGSPFVVNAALTPWTTDGTPRRAGVNSLGVGGTNAFVVLEEPPAVPSVPRARPYELLALSAKTPTALDAMSRRLAEHVRVHPDANLADVAYTLQVGRKAFDHRRVVAARDAEDAALALDGPAPARVATAIRASVEPSVVFTFAGGGAQHPGMGRELYATEPAYRAAVEECLALLPPDLTDALRRLLYPAEGACAGAAGALEAPARGLPALFVTQYALARLWQAWGVAPAAMIGHSVGEYAAACLAGVLSLEDALALVALRGELFETLPPGGMTSVHLSKAELRPLLGADLSLAAVNAPDLCVASGAVESLDRLERELDARDVPYGRVKIAVAAHSAMVEPILQRFQERVARARLRAPAIPFVSTLTGTWVTPEQVMAPGYWSRHLRETVRFADGVGTLLAEPGRAFVEVGPGQGLTSLVRQHPAVAPTQTIVPSLPRARDAESDAQSMLMALGRLWAAGLEIDWETLHAGHGRRRVPLPTYPFERTRHWVEPGRLAETVAAGVALPEPADVAAAGEPVAERSLAKQASLDDWFYRPTWQRVPRDRASAPVPLSWLLLTDGDALGARLADRLTSAGHAVTLVAPSDGFAHHGFAHHGEQGAGEPRYTLDPEQREHWDRLVMDLQDCDRLPDRIVHLWSLVPSEGDAKDACYERVQARGFYSLLHLAQAIGDAGLTASIHLSVVTSGLRSVAGETVVAPTRATLDGPCRVIPRELPNVSCQALDVKVPAALDGDALVGLVERLVAELAEPLHEPSVALRGGERWAETFERAELAAPAPEATAGRLRERGVYLITGGLGGIGLTLAEYLARMVQARLVLMGRTGLPERAEWDAVVAGRRAGDPVRRAVERVRALEALGAEVHVARADVADPAEVARVVTEAKARFGALDGVIHAAGVLDDALLQLKMRAATERVLAPKVRGALALDAALRGEPLDFVLLCSSTSALLGQAGQIDYAAANAFLDAFAASKQGEAGRGGTRWIAVDWGVWQEVGMAVRAAGGGSDVYPAGADGPVVHPLLGVRELDVPERIVYRAEYDAGALWVLDGHRLRRSGVAVLPGASYLEMARAAVAHRAAGRDVEVQDLFLLAPLAIAADESRTVWVTLECAGGDDAYALSVESAVDEPGAARTEHARATVRLAAADRVPVPRFPEDELRSATWDTRQGEVVDFGPRWDTVERFEVGDGVAVARLVLPDRFLADLDEYPLHPALFDMATSAGLPLVPGYADADDFYVPLSWERARAHAPLTPVLVSRAVLREGLAEHGLAVFDVTIADERGEVLVVVEGFTLKRVDPARLLGGEWGPAAVPGAPSAASGVATAVGCAPTTSDGRSLRARGGGRLGDLLAEGIRPSEGAEVFARVIAARELPRVVATSVDLHALLDRAGGSAAPAPASVRRAVAEAPRPTAREGYVAPRTAVEQRLAGLWREMLGVADVGAHDDFFELGGHSLVAVRLLAQVRKTFGVDLALDTLFRAPTIAAWAEIVERRGGGGVTGSGMAAGGSPGPRAALANGHVPSRAIVNGHAHASTNGHVAPNHTAAEERWSPLVEIQAGTTRPPFFCVHGAGGNVLNFRSLARLLGPEQPFYGLQARGVDGRLRPLSTVEEMAASYVAAIREVRPHGPYVLGGYSGGGMIAFEMAHQLRRAGEEVALLALIDTFAQLISRRLGRLAWQNLYAMGPSYVAYSARRVYALGRAAWSQARIALYERYGRAVPHDLRELRVEQAVIGALAAYEPARYPGRVTLFHASASDGFYCYDVPDLGWGEYAAGGVEVYAVSGNHDTMMLEPNIRALAAHLRACLDRATAAPVRA